MGQCPTSLKLEKQAVCHFSFSAQRLLMKEFASDFVKEHFPVFLQTLIPTHYFHFNCAMLGITVPPCKIALGMGLVMCAFQYVDSTSMPLGLELKITRRAIICSERRFQFPR